MAYVDIESSNKQEIVDKVSEWLENKEYIHASLGRRENGNYYFQATDEYDGDYFLKYS